MCTYMVGATNRRVGVAMVIAFAVIAAMPASGSAQTSRLDPRWQPWIGCWQPDSRQQQLPSLNTPLVCVIPATSVPASAGVDIATIVNGKIVERDYIDANGRSSARTRQGCNSVESADWSADGERVYTRSSYLCAGGTKRTSTGVFAMSPDGEWMDVQGISTQGGKGVRTLRYRDAGIPASAPREIAAALQGSVLAARDARTAAGAPLTSSDVVEASRKLDAPVVQAWLVDRGQGFALNARQLVELADAGVSSSVTDAMVALSYPKAFTVDSAARGLDAREMGTVNAARGYSVADRSLQVYLAPSNLPSDYYSPFGYGSYGYSPYGNSPYGGYYSRYNNYGPAYGSWYGVGVPTYVILRGNEQKQAPSTGHVVKGHGYTQSATGSEAGAVAHPRPSQSPPSSGSGSAEGRSSGSTSGPTRTAKPRP